MDRFRAGVAMPINGKVLALTMVQYEYLNEGMMSFYHHDQPSSPHQANESVQLATEELQEAGRKQSPSKLPFTPNESSLETFASLHGIAFTVSDRQQAPFVGYPVTHVNNAANVNNLGIYRGNWSIFRHKITKMERPKMPLFDNKNSVI